MPTPIIACSTLLFFGALIGLIPFIAAGRDLPHWIRIAHFLIALAYVGGGAVGIALYSAGDGLRAQVHEFIFLQIVLTVGMGLGIILLLLVSGEYFRALRELDAARRQRLTNEHKT